MDLVGKQVAMTKRGPTWTIFRVKSSHFLVVSDRRFIISFSAAKFSKFWDVVESHKHWRVIFIVVVLGLVLCDLLLEKLLLLHLLLLRLRIFLVFWCFVQNSSLRKFLRHRQHLILTLELRNNLLRQILCSANKLLLRRLLIAQALNDNGIYLLHRLEFILVIHHSRIGRWLRLCLKLLKELLVLQLRIMILLILFWKI